MWRACDSGVKPSLEREMLCHCRAGGVSVARAAGVNERVRFSVSVGVCGRW